MSDSPIVLSVIVPLYNENQTIIKVLNRLSETKKKDFVYEVIVINDGSTDNSLSLLEQNKDLYDQLITYKKNNGKGHAVLKGLEAAKGKYIIFQDADLEYDPKDILKFVSLINNFETDLILGSRLNYSDFTRSHNILNKFGNMFITLIFNLFYNTTFTDIYTCYLCYKKELVNNEKLKSKGFGQHAEILCEVVKKGKKFYEVPISYNGRTYEDGKKIKFYHIFEVLYRIMSGKFK
jgi:glycosyltransferase involved in cell wall biosynthesis